MSQPFNHVRLKFICHFLGKCPFHAIHTIFKTQSFLLCLKEETITSTLVAASKTGNLLSRLSCFRLICFLTANTMFCFQNKLLCFVFRFLISSLIAWSINKVLAVKLLVSSPWNGRITAIPFGGRRANGQIRRHFVSAVRILSLRECTGGIYQAAGYIRHTQLSTTRNMTKTFQNKKQVFVNLHGSLLSHSIGISFQLLFVSFYQARRSIFGSGRQLRASIFSTVRPTFELQRSCEKLPWNAACWSQLKSTIASDMAKKRCQVFGIHVFVYI